MNTTQIRKEIVAIFYLKTYILILLLEISFHLGAFPLFFLYFRYRPDEGNKSNNLPFFSPSGSFTSISISERNPQKNGFMFYFYSKQLPHFLTCSVVARRIRKRGGCDASREGASKQLDY